MKKYWEVFKTEFKVSLTYRMDILVSAAFSAFRIVLIYLLWSAVYSNNQTIEGMNLQEMVTYYLIGLIISPVTQGEGLLYDFAEEVRNGQYSKYMVRPMSPLYYFASGSIARQIVPTVIGAVTFGIVLAFGGQYFAPISVSGLVVCIITCILAMFINIIISYIISASAFKFTMIAGFHVTITVIKTLLSGSLIPLNLLFGERVAVLIPFAYTNYFPAMQCLGKSGTSLWISTSVLIVWIFILFLIAKRIEKTAPKYFEGVGI